MKKPSFKAYQDGTYAFVKILYDKNRAMRGKWCGPYPSLRAAWDAWIASCV